MSTTKHPLASCYLDDERKTRLEKIAAHKGVSMSGQVRMWIDGAQCMDSLIRQSIAASWASVRRNSDTCILSLDDDLNRPSEGVVLLVFPTKVIL